MNAQIKQLLTHISMEIGLTLSMLQMRENIPAYFFRKT